MKNKLLQKTKKRFILNIFEGILCLFTILFSAILVLLLMTILLIFVPSIIFLLLMGIIFCVVIGWIIYDVILLTWKKSRKQAEKELENGHK